MKQRVALALGALALVLGGVGLAVAQVPPAACDTACVHANEEDGGTGNGGMPTRSPDEER